MSHFRPLMQCPLCGTLAPVASLTCHPQGVEMGCGHCGNMIRYKPYSALDDDDIGASTSQSNGASTTQAASDAAEEKDKNRVSKSQINDPLDASDRDDGGSASAAAAALANEKNQALLALLDKVEGLTEDLREGYIEAVTTGDSLEKHRELVKRAVAMDLLKPAGILYRERLILDPEDPVAKACQNQIINAAMIKLEPLRGQSNTGGKSKTIQLLIASVFLAVGLSLFAWVMQGSPTP